MLPWLLLACSPGTLVAEPGALRIVTEPGIDTVAELSVTNTTRGAVVIDQITFEPDDAPVTWGGDGPWTLEPGTAASVRVLFRPAGPGEWDATMLVGTTIGGLPVPLELIAAPGVDEDSDGWSPLSGDCDDHDGDVLPGGIEACDGKDNDCDGAADEDFDQDRDGHLVEAGCEAVGGDDCDDGDRTAHAGHEEDCDQTDSDCDGIVDNTTAAAALQEGVCAGATKVCDRGAAIEPDYGAIAGYEAAERSCDGLDNDCDGLADGFDRSGDGTSDCEDDDGDGASEAQGDCDDADAERTPAGCGAQRLLVTSTEDGFTTLDLNLRAAARHPLGGTLYDAAVGGDVAWLTDRADLVVAADPLTGGVIDVSSRGAPTWGIVHDPARGRVWVGREGGRMEALDDVTLDLELTADVGLGGLGLALDGDGLWACGEDGVLWWIDAETGATDRIVVDVTCYGAPIVDAARDRVLVLGYLELELVAVDRTTREEVDRVALADRAIRGQLALGALWLATGVDDAVVRMDPASFEVLDTFGLGAQVADLWVDEIRGDLWATLWTEDEIVRVDPTSGAITERVASPAPMLMEALPP